MTSESPPDPEPMSRKEFFVDTKTTCFLCLSDIPYFPPVIDLENEEEDNNEGSFEGEKFYIKPIFRYLNINPGKLFKKQLALYDSTKFLSISDWKVLLCRECLPFANRVSEFCLDMEMLQMKMNYSIQKFQEIIDKSEKDVTKVEKFRGTPTNPPDTLQVTIADLLRNETRLKCNVHFKKSSPMVNVKMIKETSTPAPPAEIISEPITPELPPPPPFTIPPTQNVMTPGKYKCHLCNAPFGARSGLTSHIQRRHTPNPAPAPAPAPSIEPPITKLPIQKNGRHKCLICKTSYMISSSLSRHMRRYHPNNSGSTITCNKCGLKLPSRPEWIKHTRLYCHLRSTNITSRERLEKPPPPPLHILQPPPPPISTGSSTPLTTVNLSKMIDSIPHLKTGNNGLLCALCPLSSSITPNEIFQREDLLRRHMFLNHLDYFFGPVKHPEVSSEQFKALCKEIVENDMKPTQNTGAPGSGRFGSLTFACAHCSSTFYEKRAMNAHLIRSHYSVLAPKLVDLQRSQGVPIMNTPPTPVEVVPSKATSSNRQTFKCEDCYLSFRSTIALYHHRQYSCKVLNQNSSLSNAGKDPMAPLIEAHLKRFRKKRSEVGYPGKYSCAECGHTFAHMSSLYRHKNTNHKVDVFEPSQQPVSDADISCDRVTKTFIDPPQWRCEDCGNIFSCSSSMYRHQRQNCVERVAKGGVDEQSGVTVVMESEDGDMDLEQNYFYETNEGEGEMGNEEQGEVYEEEDYTDSYVNTKIEVIEMDQVQILPKMEGGQVEDDVYQDNLIITEGGGGGEEEMILPGPSYDPLF